ncbi:hypothetical protein [Methylobacterium nigriterrae]|uniref:hypothetical protein n=1 Tax=Methylobacterium nigriterrae TaxID=3127512 RepID=UPI003013710A
MILALFALAALMIIGGTASVIQGFPFVRLESGLAMVIAGATVASAGAVLIGLGAVALGLKHVERAFAARRGLDAAPAPDFGTRPQAAPPRLDPILPEAPAAAFGTARPILGGAAFGGAALGAATLGGAAPATGRTPTEPTFADALVARRDEPAARPDPAEPELPLAEPLTEPSAAMPEPGTGSTEPSPAAEPDDGIAPEDDLFAAPEPVRPAASEAEVAPPLRPALDTAPEPEAPSEPEPAQEPAETEPKLEVVGTYASGGNTYVMYSNGAIEADTPRGRFTFGSLDELKAFVESGGESDARGAA